MTDKDQAIKDLIDLGASMAQIREPIEGRPFIVVPNGYKMEDLERLQHYPQRKRGQVFATDSDSFIAYLKKHGIGLFSTIYADIDAENSKCDLVAVLNDHGEYIDEPRWQDFRCMFKPKLAIEWKRWTGKDRAVFTQEEFATWLEDNLGDIANVDGMPTGSQILAMALDFEAHADKKFRSKMKLQSGGVQFEFIEDETKNTSSKMQVFERFTLGLPVFDGSRDAYPLEARLKYREKSGVLSFWYELIRPDRVFRTATESELSRIRAETGFDVITGTIGK